MKNINNHFICEYIDELNEIELEKYSDIGYIKKIYNYSNNIFLFVVKISVLYLIYVSLKYLYQ